MPIISLPRPAITRSVAGKLDGVLAELRAGTDDAYYEPVTADTTEEKVRAKFSSAIGSYRARTGDKAAFAIRAVEGGVDGQPAIGIWKEVGEFKPRGPRKQKAAE